MPTFLATMRVVHIETWQVDAKDTAEARAKFSELTKDVIDDDAGGEVVDWEVESVEEQKE